MKAPHLGHLMLIRFYKRNESTGAYDAINLDLAAV
ncbi:MAG: DUF3164 family protein [Comamonas sp.]|nr:DUF3164 family protein [Comamonas testosteroni]MDN5504613.1 DUF3164 family protein [Comamonas sp.]WQG65081.1 DUF3164 family protein [Comamonas testosteroni]